MLSDIFKKIEVSPKVSFWISVAALAIVLFNNHIYITSVQEREREAKVMMQRNIAEAETLAGRERLLKTWEVALIQREAEIKELILKFKAGKIDR